MSNNLYMNINMLQTVPASCINRDDTGSPKTSTYGGSPRARISSQSKKYACRIEDNLKSPEHVAISFRTRQICALLIERILKYNPEISEKEACKIAEMAAIMSGIKSKDDKKTAMFFISGKQVDNLAQVALEYSNISVKDKATEDEYKKKMQKAVIDNPSRDILLYGRMSASNPMLGYDACVQVAQCISTHSVRNESDYFTAVDDCSEVGAGHIDTAEFNSATYYMHANLNITELSKYYDIADLKLSIAAFADVFIYTIPKGKQNSFAHKTFPDMVYVTMQDTMFNLANAFERALPPSPEGYITRSEKRLIDYARIKYEDFSAYPKKEWVMGGSADYGVQKVTFSGLIDGISDVVDQHFS